MANADQNNVTKRSSKNRPLTFAEGDQNLDELINVIDDNQALDEDVNGVGGVDERLTDVEQTRVRYDELNSTTAGEGASLVTLENGESVQTDSENKDTEIQNRVIRVSSRTEMKAYDVPAGYQFSLEEGGRSGIFVVKTGTPPSDPQEGIYIVLNNGNYAERFDFDYITPEMFGAVGDGLTDCTTEMQASWDYSSNNHVPVILTSDQPYTVTKLYLKKNITILGAADNATILLHSSATGSSGFFIDREDDGIRYFYGRIENVLFATAISGVSGAQDNNPDLAGICMIACDSWYLKNVRVWGFGQGGILLGRAEGGNEGLGFVNTTEDGNYNTFHHIYFVRCGKYRTDQLNAGIIFLYKANSNKLSSIYAKGMPNAGCLAFGHADDNAVYGATAESGKYAVIISGPESRENMVYNIRAEGMEATVRGINNADPSNIIVGGRRSSTNTLRSMESGSNVSVTHYTDSPFTYRIPLQNDTHKRDFGFIDVLGAKCEDKTGDPFYIIAGTENNPDFIPRLQLKSQATGPNITDPIGSIEFYNAIVNGGGVNARIDALFDGGSARTYLSFKTGKDNNPIEALVIRALDSATVPGTDNAFNLGISSKRWAQIYAANGTIQTSDEREKEQQRDLTASESAVAKELKSKIKAFKWSEAVKSKGDDARWHFGVMAQEVERVFSENGLDANEYGLFCKDEWYDGDVTFDENGEVIEMEPNKERYGVRYDQLLAFIISAL